jgi:hypothetical protein
MLDEMLAPLWFSTRGKYIGLSLLVLALLLLVTTFYQTVHGWYLDLTIVHKPVTHTAVVDNDAKLIAKLPDQHLFGAAPAGDFIPLSSLSLHITSILQSSQANGSRVILASEGAPGKIYKVGDILAAGIRISAIDATGIQLEQGSHVEKLSLARAPLIFQDKPKAIG